MAVNNKHIKYYKFLIGHTDTLDEKALTIMLRKQFKVLPMKIAREVAHEWSHNSGHIIDRLGLDEYECSETEEEHDEHDEQDEDDEDGEEDEEDDEKMQVCETSSETSSSSTAEEISNIWDDTKTYTPETRIAFKRRVYEAKRTTNAHPTSRFDWKVLPRNVAFVKKADKIKRVKSTQGSIEKKGAKGVKGEKKMTRNDKMLEILTRLEMAVERLSQI
jgi:hypothetical protein